MPDDPYFKIAIFVRKATINDAYNVRYTVDCCAAFCHIECGYSGSKPGKAVCFAKARRDAAVFGDDQEP
jgi:hypothetical protein